LAAAGYSWSTSSWADKQLFLTVRFFAQKARFSGMHAADHS